ncbi:MAG: UvrB/UvrC motif-containing protein [Elusimicrobiota bacterium]|jgi:protein arginine kinase activator
MLCSRCQKNPAGVHVQQIVNNQLTQLHLCAECAELAELPGSGAAPIFELLAKLGGLPSGRPARAKEPACRSCGLRYEEFRKTGMLGCPGCYESFAPQLSEVLRNIQGSVRHHGKRPGAPAPKKGREDAAKLREKLKAAVAAEDFEEAARLRDLLKGLER